MLGIEKVDHVGIRVSDNARAMAFYEGLGPGNTANDKNVLMDVDEKFPGITHVSYKVTSMAAAKRFLAERGIAITGEFSFKGMHAIFIRDPDRNVIELDAYRGEEPATRADSAAGSEGYQAHP